MSIGLDKTCAWNIDAHRGRSLVAFGYGGECHVYHVKKNIAKKPQPQQLLITKMRRKLRFEKINFKCLIIHFKIPQKYELS